MQRVNGCTTGALFNAVRRVQQAMAQNIALTSNDGKATALNNSNNKDK